MYPHTAFALHNLTSKHTVKPNQSMSSPHLVKQLMQKMTPANKTNSSFFIPHLAHHPKLQLVLLILYQYIPTPLPSDTFKFPHTLLHQTLSNSHTPSSTRCFQPSTHPPPPLSSFHIHSSTRHFQTATHPPPPDAFKLPHTLLHHFQASTQQTLLHQTLSSFHTTHTPPPDTFKLPQMLLYPRLSNFYMHSST